MLRTLAPLVVAAVLLSTAAALAPVDRAPAPETAGRALDAGGAFTCDFGLSDDISMDEIGPGIERDRMYMAARPGMQHKLIPMAPDPVAGELVSGGRYLFDTEADAHEYIRWVREDFELDGVLFLERSAFRHPDCHAWRVIGAQELLPLRTHHHLLRTERWNVPDADLTATLHAAWPGLVAEAEARGLAAVWLLYAPHDRMVSLVYVAPRLAPAPANPDVGGLALLAAAPPLGAAFDGEGWDKYFDSSHWVLTVWFPFVLGDHGEAALWPHSPPLPEPYVGDGVCEVSRGERHANAPDDCRPHCGNGHWDHDESWRDCPGDVRLFG